METTTIRQTAAMQIMRSRIVSHGIFVISDVVVAESAEEWEEELAKELEDLGLQVGGEEGGAGDDQWEDELNSC